MNVNYVSGLLRQSSSQLQKMQDCANVSSNSSLLECMRRGWRAPRVDSLKFVNYTIIENAHKVRKKSFVFYVAAICTATEGTE